MENDRLTLDAIAARKDGMTYGKWKALHPHTDGTVKVVTEPSKKFTKCAWCGQLFLAGKGKKFCGTRCQQQNYYYNNIELVHARDKARRDKKKLEKENGHED